MSSGYDDWLATTPEDEAATAKERERRKAAADEYRSDNPRQYRAQFINGRKVYEEDYIYDPLSRRGYE